MLVVFGAIAIATALWLPSLHLLFAPEASAPGVSVQAQALAARQSAYWSDELDRRREAGRLRITNAEWDFMGRSFLVWALGNLCLREPERCAPRLALIDRIIEDTVRTEREAGMYHFLMPYARARPWRQRPERSIFLDGEIAMMLATRRMVEDREDYRSALAERVDVMVDRMQAGPVLSAESYPDECWTFCNTVALAAIRMADVLEGTDHQELLRRWVEVARTKLTDPTTGLLVSSYTFDGHHLDGPEGSSIWMAAHDLLLVDEPFARDQYERAKRELGVELLGFGLAREWPRSWQGPADVDSGPIVPILGASAGSSGLALLGASAFGDTEYLTKLRTTLEFAAFPIEQAGQLYYAASNQVGDAVLLYSLVQGPLFDRVKQGARP